MAVLHLLHHLCYDLWAGKANKNESKIPSDRPRKYTPCCRLHRDRPLRGRSHHHQHQQLSCTNKRNGQRCQCAVTVAHRLDHPPIALSNGQNGPHYSCGVITGTLPNAVRFGTICPLSLTGAIFPHRRIGSADQHHQLFLCVLCWHPGGIISPPARCRNVHDRSNKFGRSFPFESDRGGSEPVKTE